VRRAENGADRIRQRVGCERLSSDRGSLEQSQSNQIAVEPCCVSVDDPVTLKPESHESELGAARGIAEKLSHEFRLASIAASAGSAGARPQTRSRAKKHHGARSAPVFSTQILS
jgi:hypothetical protein